MVKRTKKSKRPRVAALSPRYHPRSVAWSIDIDYAHKLSSHERQWLAVFLDRFYGANMRPAYGSKDWTTAEKRKAYRAKNSANRDLYTAVPMDQAGAEPAGELGDIGPTPAYLDTPRYQAALAEYREAVDAKDAERIKRARVAQDWSKYDEQEV